MGTRGCGSRQAGGMYLTTPLSASGSPIEAFLVDPPFRVDPELERRLMLSDVGVKVIKRAKREGDVGPDVYDVWDIVGQNNYPNVADMIQEIRGMGISRRISASEDFALLGPESKLIMLHRRAWIDNYHDYYGALFMENDDLKASSPAMVQDVGCPRRKLNAYYAASGRTALTVLEPHSCEQDGNSRDLCLGLAFEDVEGGETLYDPTLRPRTVKRSVGDTTYLARHRPDGITPVYGLAVFGRFPIGQIDVILDRANGTHAERIAKAKRSSLPVSLEEE